MTDLHVRVRAARKALKLTQQQVADLAGVSLNTYQMFETGKSSPQGANLQAMLLAVGIDGTGPARAESTREEWPGDIRVFLDVMGAYLMTMTPEQRLDFIHEQTRRIIRSG